MGISLEANLRRRQAVAMVAGATWSKSALAQPGIVVVPVPPQTMNSARSAANAAASRIACQGFITRRGFNALARARPGPIAIR